jgi:iron-sulfur cluster assembly protein
MTIPLTLTDAAKARIMALTASDPDCVGVKLWIAKGKGCGGNEYKMELVKTAPPAHDSLPVGEGAALYIPVSDSFLMFGMVIDYAADPKQLGVERFTFTNPNEAGRCGCGESVMFDKA